MLIFARKSSHEVESKDNGYQNSKDAGILRGVWRELQERQEVKPEAGTSNCTEQYPLVAVIIIVQGVFLTAPSPEFAKCYLVSNQF